ncbi:gamma-aminobutyric acid (GABA) type B receptor [Oopsacas minuta]|uniref:Gamma-aminobutyric acid (GABA) type B receptor n=1 Tax=Oopsacas minuta TaxID=111878 RepID=A0AAV7K3J0_9METZ|nr:gamma-aminobutyric acid (GABA) type B receptor [Oopsacas minuta]
MRAIIFVICLSILAANCQKVDIHIAGIYPANGSWSAPNIPISVRLALEHINSNNVVPGYTLRIDLENSQCKNTIGLSRLFHFIQNPNYTYVSLFGDGCSVVTGAVAEISYLYGLVSVAFASTSPSLANTERYPTLIRSRPSESSTIPARLRFITENGWKRIAIINQQEDLFVSTSHELQKLLNIDSVHYRIEIIDPKGPNLLEQLQGALALIEKEGYRIIVANMYQTLAVQLLCIMKSSGLQPPLVTWIFPGWYTDSWYDSPVQLSNITCTPEEIKRLSNGSLAFYAGPRFVDFNAENSTTISGYTAEQLFAEYSERVEKESNTSPNPTFIETAYAYDSMWMIAQGLSKIALAYDLTKHPSEYANDLYNNITSLSFIGWSGEISFVGHQRVERRVQLLEFVNGKLEYRGLFDNVPVHESDYIQTDDITYNEIYPFTVWSPDKASDGIEIHFVDIWIVVVVFISAVMSSIYVSIVIIVILVGIAKKLKAVTTSQPWITILITSGNYFVFILAIVFVIDGRILGIGSKKNEQACYFICHLRIWLGSVWVSTTFGGILVKSLRYYIIAIKNRFEYRRELSTKYILIFPLLLVGIDTIFVLILRLVQPVTFMESEVSSGKINPPIYQISECGIEMGNSYIVILIILVLFKVLLMLLSILMAYNIRNIVNKNQRFSAIVSWVTYNGTVFVITVSLIYSFVSDVNIKYPLCAIAILVGGLITASIISAPTLHYMRVDPNYIEGAHTGATDAFPEDIQILRKRIEALERDKNNLEHRLVKRLSRSIPNVIMEDEMMRLSKHFLGIELNKDPQLQRSNWQSQNLTFQQIKYASIDAKVSLDILFAILQIICKERSIPQAVQCPSISSEFIDLVFDICGPLIDIPFGGGSSKTQQRQRNNSGVITADSPRVKNITTPYVTRKRALYENCRLLAPDNELLSLIDTRKANWYFERDLAELVSEEPYVVRLKFEPKTRPEKGNIDKLYYQAEKQNICVVCGSKDGNGIRKKIVPAEYRK